MNENKDLCYKPSRWQRMLWREFRDEMADPETLAKSEKSGVADWDIFRRESFSRFYSDHVPGLEAAERGPEAEWAARAHEAAEQLPEYAALRERTRGDQVWSGLSAMNIAEQVGEALPTPPPPEARQDMESLRRQIAGLKGLKQAAPEGGSAELDTQQRLAERALAQGEKAMAEWAESMQPSALRQAFRKATEKANKALDDAQEAAAAFGYGDAAGSAGKSGTAQERASLFRRLQSSRKLLKIAAQAGRMRRIAARKQRDKVRHAPDEVVDIEQGADLGRVLPAELARLKHPLRRMAFLRDFTERRLLQYRMDGKEPQGAGPIIVAIDNSGSMSGAPEVWAKGVALALLDVAMRQKRAFGILHWDRRVGYERIWKAGKADTATLLDAMEFFSGGGTNIRPAAARALKMIETEGALKKADVIIITDGDAGHDGADEYKAQAKEMGVTTYGVLIGGRGYKSEALTAWSDQVIPISDLAADTEVHDTVLAI